MNTLATLPTEIISLIVAHLDQTRDLYNCAMLNSRFYSTVNPLLWRSIHLQHQDCGLLFLYCLVTVKRSVGQWIRDVHLHDFYWTDKSLLVLMRRAPLVTCLVLDNATRITDTSMQHLAYYWPHIQSLHLAYSPITHLSYRVLGQHCPKLTNLELWNCPGLQPTTFSMYFVDSSPLERLMLATWVPEEEEEDPRGTVDPYLANDTTIDMAGLRSLTHLKIHGAPFGMLHHATQRGVWPHMASIDLEACFDMVDDDAILLVHALPPGLTHLAMKDGDFTNLTLDAIATCQPNLVELDVSSNTQLTASVIRRLVHRCHRLTLIKLSYCGMTMGDFPEAGPECAGTVVTFHGTFSGLDHLDQHAIALIRRGPDLPNQDDDEQDSDGGDDER